MDIDVDGDLLVSDGPMMMPLAVEPIPSYWESVAQFLHALGLAFQRPIYASTDVVIRAVATPIRPGEDGNYSSSTLEAVSRCVSLVFHVLLAPLTVTFFALGEGLHFVADMSSSTPYIQFQGEGKETANPNHFKMFTLNTCMLWGGLPRPLGGVVSPDDRIEQMVQLIRKADADMVFLQEVSYGPSVDLYRHLEKEYPHCYTRIGPNPFRMESGLCIFSKFEILGVRFVPFPDQNGMKRGVFIVETPTYYFLNTHMESGQQEDEIAKRGAQFALIVKQIEALKRKSPKPCFFGGDLNIDRLNNPEEYQRLIGANPQFYDPYFQRHPEIDEASATQTNLLLSHMLGQGRPERPFEMDDYLLLHGNAEAFQMETTQVDTFSLDRPSTSISDHKGLLVEVSRVAPRA